jgi:pantoate--beta-alanine ligase
VAQRPDTVADELAQGAAELREAGFALEYLEIRESETLALVTAEVTAPARVFAAAHLGRTRLIDNVPIV